VLLVLDRLGALSEKVKRALRVFKSFSITVGPDGSLSGGINVDPHAERLFTFPVVGPLAPDEARLAVTRPAEAAGVAVEPAAVEQILAHTRGYPYFLQEWAYETWNVADQGRITLADVDRAAPRVMDKLDTNFFRVRFDRLTPTEKKYLRAMAELGPGPHRSGEIAREYGARVESVGPMRNALIRKRMIYSPSHGDTAFTVPLFDEFLKRAIPRAVAQATDDAGKSQPGKTSTAG